MGGLTHWFQPLPRPCTLGYSDGRTHPLVTASAPPLHIRVQQWWADSPTGSRLCPDPVQHVHHVQQFNLVWHTQCCGSGGPEWFWSAGSGSRRAKKAAHKKETTKIFFMIWSAGCSLLKAWDFSYSLAVLHGGLGINVPVWQILTKKIRIFSPSKFFLFNFWSSNPWIRIRINLKCWIGIRIEPMRIHSTGRTRSSDEKNNTKRSGWQFSSQKLKIWSDQSMINFNPAGLDKKGVKFAITCITFCTYSCQTKQNVSLCFSATWRFLFMMFPNI